MRESRNGFRPITIYTCDDKELKGYFINFHTVSFVELCDGFGGVNSEQWLTAELENGELFDNVYVTIKFDDV